MDVATIAVKVRFMGGLRAIVPQRDVTIALPQGSTVGDLLRSLSASYGQAFARQVFSASGKVHHYILIFVNGRDIRELGGVTAGLGQSEVEIIMLPMFDGG